MNRHVGAPLLAYVVDQSLVEVVDADGGDGAVDFAMQGAGNREGWRQVTRRGDAESFDAVFQFVEFAVKGDLSVAEDGNAIGDSFEIAGDMSAEEDRAARVVDDLENRAEEFTAGGWVETGDRLVEDE